MNLPDISKIRGMGEPMFFEFDTKTSKKLLCHGVIFVSFELADPKKVVKLFTPDGDPRAAHFINYCVNNHAKKLRDQLREEIKKMTAEINDLDVKITKLKKELNER